MRKVILQLVLQEGLGAALMAKLYQRVSVEGLLQLSHLSCEDIAKACDVPFAKAQLIKDALRSETAYQHHEAWCESQGVDAVLFGEPAYPELLAHIATPPAVLWVKGRLPAADDTLCALVGSRDASHYGRRAVQMIVPALVQRNIITVSGGARGIDAFVHEETIKAGGKTIAVMGCGLAHTYPAEHAPLFQRIVESGGALISPFPPHISPLPGLFPVRNRIIAGLAQSCIVVQAAAKSGALITATHALEENREVGAVPGHIDDPLAAGANALLSQGARVIVDGASAVELCGKKAERIRGEAIIATMDPEQARLLALLDVPKSFDVLLEEYGGGPQALHEQLFLLQVAARVKQDHAGFWVRFN